MADKPMDWCRLYNDMADDIKFEIAARETGIDHDAVVGKWARILNHANRSPIRGSLYATLQKRYTDDDVTITLRCPPELIRAFIELEMLEIDENGAYRVKNFGKRNFSSDNSTQRVSEWRKKRSGNVSETPPETESKTETELIKLESIEREMLEMWRLLFPEKPQPKPGTYRDKINARLKDKEFQENWKTALEHASLSPSCQDKDASWFTFEFFVRNNKNYQNMINNWLAWKDAEMRKPRGVAKPTSPPASAIDPRKAALNELRQEARNGRT